MKKALSLFALGLAALAGGAHSQTKEFDFKGVSLGASEAAFLQVHRYFECSDRPDARRHCVLEPANCPDTDCHRQATYGGVPVKRVVAIFDHDALKIVRVDVARPWFDDLYAGMEKRFGKPQPLSGDRVRTEKGLVPAGVIWARPGSVVAAERVSSPDRGLASITIMTRPEIDAVNRRAAREKIEQVRRSASDL